MSAYDEGKQACIDGKRTTACPYKGTKKEVVARVDWLQGYAYQAWTEANNAVLKLKRSVAARRSNPPS